MQCQNLPHRSLTAVPAEQVIVEEEVRPGHGEDQDQFAQSVKMLGSQEVIHVFEGGPQHIEDGHHCRDTRKNSANDEIGAEDGGMPPGYLTYGKIPRHDGVYREHHRDDGKGENLNGFFQAEPFSFGAAPAKRQDFVGGMAKTSCAVARHGQVWHQRQVQVNGAAEQVSGDCQQVPHQRGTEVRPKPAGVRVGHHKIKHPNAPQVNEWVKRAGCQAEGGHKFGGAGKRPAEFRLEHPQNGRNEGTGVADADPKHEGDDEHAPVNGPAQPGDPHAGADHVTPGAKEQHGHPRTQTDGPQPEFSGRGSHHLHDHAVQLLTRARIEHELFFRVFVLLLGRF